MKDAVPDDTITPVEGMMQIDICRYGKFSFENTELM